MTEGWGVEEEQAYPKALENRLLQNVEVWNLGVVDYETSQELQLLRRFIGQSRPDIVVLGFYQNEVADNTRGYSEFAGRKPLYALQGDRLVLSNAAALRQRREDWDRASRSLWGRIRRILLQSAVIRLVTFTIATANHNRMMHNRFRSARGDY